MPDTPCFTPREIAELTHVPKRVVEKAIEERVLHPRTRTVPANGRRARRTLPMYAVAYVTIVSKLDLKLGLAEKRRLAMWLARNANGRVRRHARLEIAPSVELKVGPLLGDVLRRAERYRCARDKWIVIDEEIMGGTPVIRGTRMTVYSVLGRVDHGDRVEEILEDNPDLSRAAIEAALTYARSHPFIGRPGGRSWIKAA
jgi:uncharacterized protein (DUF433 family)